MTQYKTLEAQQSAATVITGCIDAINSEKGLPYQLGTLTVDYITKYLAEYRKLIEKDIEERLRAEPDWVESVEARMEESEE